MTRFFRMRRISFFAVAAMALFIGAVAFPDDTGPSREIDRTVRKFLDEHKTLWADENVTEIDGKTLFDLVVEHKYTRALEIGTSTGHSGIWIAWAMSRTGGRLVTIEIDQVRHEKALANFKAAGLEAFVDARLADAHELVPELKGPFDFVFLDADKDWYENYFKLLLPKLDVGGCFAAHNVLNLEFMHGVKEFLDYVRGLPEVETTIERKGSGGISLSFKKKLS
jgi:caffeoyl-CoA O-methyltransferase